MRTLRLRPLTAALALLGLAASPSATWSIVVVNTETGEVVIGAATCITGFNLVKDLPVMRVGQGGAVSQGLIDFGCVHRLKIWNGLIAGDTPDEIVQTLVTTGSSVAQRQWGIVDFENPPATYDGSLLGDAHHGVTGVVGPLRYAIQGNILTADLVVTAAEAAFLGASGDTTQRVMAGMEAARALGGDGRCSCSPTAPTSCGAPPPGFTKSAHVAFLVGSRMGDADGQCYWALGCAQEDYYVKLNVIGGASDIDPVLQLQQDYAAWRAALLGHPDHLKSTVEAHAQSLVADGLSTTDVRVRLFDLEGQPIPHGGAAITVETESGLPPAATPGPAIDHQDGSYTIPFQAGATPGEDRFLIRVDDGVEVATLFPYLELAVDPLAPLHVGTSALSASAGGAAPFTLNLGAGAAGHPYLLVAGVSGTSPGVDLGASILPINPDGITQTTLAIAGGPMLPGSIGLCDGAGRAQAALLAAPGALASLVGVELVWAAVELAGAQLLATNAVGLDVVP